MPIDFTGVAPGWPEAVPAGALTRLAPGPAEREIRCRRGWAWGGRVAAGWLLAVAVASAVAVAGEAADAGTPDAVGAVETAETVEVAPPPTPAPGRPELSPSQQRENQPAFSGRGGRRASTAGADADADPAEGGTRRVSRSPAGSVFWVLVYLVAMGGGLWLALKFVKKYLPGGQKYFAHPSMEILGRAPLDARRYLALVRVGRRLLVVGIGPEVMSPMADIADPDEVAGILEAGRPTSEAGKAVFRELFKRQTERAEAAARAEEARADAEALSGEVSDLRERVRSLRENE